MLSLTLRSDLSPGLLPFLSQTRSQSIMLALNRLTPLTENTVLDQLNTSINQSFSRQFNNHFDKQPRNRGPYYHV